MSHMNTPVISEVQKLQILSFECGMIFISIFINQKKKTFSEVVKSLPRILGFQRSSLKVTVLSWIIVEPVMWLVSCSH